jgi:uncharacterized protein (DUF4415 family)
MIRTEPVQSAMQPPAAPPKKKTAPATGKPKRERGRPASGKKVLVIRLDPDVIEKFRATGKGWQARINEALRAAKP